MKLLSSDYDGTLNVFEYDIWLNLAYINNFISRGNIFVLNTGRVYDSIKKEIDKYHIPYSYLACNDGNLLLNRNDELVYSTNIHNDINRALSMLKLMFQNIALEPVIYNGNVLEYELITSHIDDKFLLELNMICSLYNLCYKTFHIKDKQHIYICDKSISKSTAINKISELEKIEKCDIFTIGDDQNDFEMINDFNGYTFPWGKDELKSVSHGICDSVACLIKKIT